MSTRDAILDLETSEILKHVATLNATINKEEKFVTNQRAFAPEHQDAVVEE
jgi:hypothetical protein